MVIVVVILRIFEILENWSACMNACKGRVSPTDLSCSSLILLLVCLNVLAFQFSGAKEQRRQGVRPSCGCVCNISFRFTGLPGVWPLYECISFLAFCSIFVLAGASVNLSLPPIFCCSYFHIHSYITRFCTRMCEQRNCWLWLLIWQLLVARTPQARVACDMKNW